MPVYPTLTKSFMPPMINAGQSTTLTFTLTNPPGNPGVSNVNFYDYLPSSLQVAAIPNVTGTCPNALMATMAMPGNTNVSVSSLQVPAGPSSCTVSVNITNKT